ncbi:DUF3806 domain-containing protein [Leptospira bouyouniensis]|uniref:DUF3806 domain-containing protein n=1 Tax=Leptospira bouyouniensis TaxID=2484911 RepID=UPI0010913369|nr:DUF3806 domain-containing protein [Leptospira bouyouniensis]TGM74780.1 DUF3806 domain-containing protein [Leptospira bouyouniensis]
MKKRIFTILSILIISLTMDLTSQPIYKDKNIAIFNPSNEEKEQLNYLRYEAIKFIKEKTKKEITKPISIELLQDAINRINKHTNENILYGFGVLLGDYFVEKHKMKWITIEDEYGKDLVISIEKTLYYIGVITIISKRVENNEKVDVQYLISQIEKHMKENLKDYKTY